MADPIYAPVIIPTLCRYEHFVRCIESLKANSQAVYTELYIGLDFPCKPSHEEGYYKIKEYINSSLTGFAKINIFEHKENLGAMGNISFLQNKAFEDYDRYIFTEDDNEFSPNYLEYMNLCLNEFKDDINVMAISGYHYPYDRLRFTGNVISSNVYFSAWGYGIWKDRFDTFSAGINWELFNKKYKSTSFMNSLCKTAPNQYCYFVKSMLGYVPELLSSEKIPLIDLSMGLYMFMTNKKMIFPVVSKVRNWGYDGSGANCSNLSFDENAKITHRNFNTACQELDDSYSFTSIDCETNLSQIEINNLMNTFFELDKNELFRSKLAYSISRIIGLKLSRKVIAKK